jgi:hypothetical protein
MASALAAPATHDMLRRLATYAPASFRAGPAGRAFAAPVVPGGVGAFDSLLIGGLRMCSDTLLAGNANVTYPMKIVLLTTGLLPAFDSQ